MRARRVAEFNEFADFSEVDELIDRATVTPAVVPGADRV
jgi:hypothetical protein